MTRRLMQLALIVAGGVLLVASVDYQKLMSRDHLVRQLQRTLADAAVTRLLDDVPALRQSGTSFPGTIASDSGGIVAHALRNQLAPLSIADASNHPESALRVDGQVEEWVTDPLPVARLEVTLRVTNKDGERYSRRFSIRAAEESVVLRPIALPSPWWLQHSVSFDSEETPQNRLWLAACLLLPWLLMEAVQMLVRSKSWLLTSVLALAFLAGVAWAVEPLWQHFEDRRELWVVVVFCSCWVLMHIEVPENKPECS